MARREIIDVNDRRAAVCALMGGACLVAASISGCGSPSLGTSEPFESAPRQSSRAPAENSASKAAPPGQRTTESVDSVTSENASGVKLSGRVLYRGASPIRRTINMSKDAKCAELHGDKPVIDEELIVSTDGGVKDAFVRVQRGAPKKEYPMPQKPAELNQQGCLFRPRVQGIRVGQKLLVDNGDPVTHNVRSFPVLNDAFNFGQPPKSGKRERVFGRAEREIEIQCDFHPWMHAYIFVMDHPFYSVSADDGSYAIEGLPPGEYTLEFWHEKLGKQRQTVKVSEVDVSDVNVMYKR